jgi:hypothetical protein
MINIRYAHPFAEIPIATLTKAHRLFVLKANLTGQLIEFDLATLKDHVAVELEVAHIGPLPALNVVEDFGTREIAIEGEIPRDIATDGIIDELQTQLGMCMALITSGRILENIAILDSN